MIFRLFLIIVSILNTEQAPITVLKQDLDDMGKMLSQITVNNAEINILNDICQDLLEEISNLVSQYNKYIIVFNRYEQANKNIAEIQHNIKKNNELLERLEEYLDHIKELNALDLEENKEENEISYNYSEEKIKQLRTKLEELTYSYKQSEKERVDAEKAVNEFMSGKDYYVMTLPLLVDIVKKKYDEYKKQVVTIKELKNINEDLQNDIEHKRLKVYNEMDNLIIQTERDINIKDNIEKENKDEKADGNHLETTPPDTKQNKDTYNENQNSKIQEYKPLQTKSTSTQTETILQDKKTVESEKNTKNKDKIFLDTIQNEKSKYKHDTKNKSVEEESETDGFEVYPLRKTYKDTRNSNRTPIDVFERDKPKRNNNDKKIEDNAKNPTETDKFDKSLDKSSKDKKPGKKIEDKNTNDTIKEKFPKMDADTTDLYMNNGIIKDNKRYNRKKIYIYHEDDQLGDVIVLDISMIRNISKNDKEIMEYKNKLLNIRIFIVLSLFIIIVIILSYLIYKYLPN